MTMLSLKHLNQNVVLSKQSFLSLTPEPSCVAFVGSLALSTQQSLGLFSGLA